MPSGLGSINGAWGSKMASTADLIARFEGFRETPYWDVNALRAGFGSDTVTLPDGRVVPVSSGTSVSREDALRDLNRRIGTEFQPSVVNALGQDTFNALSPDQQSVLTSLAYNYGAGAWGKGLRSVAAAVQTPGTEDDIAAIRALGRHNGGVNAKRRNAEADIYAGSGQSYAPSAAGQQAPAFDPSAYIAMLEQRAKGQQQDQAWQRATTQTPLRTTEITNALAAPQAQFYGDWLRG